MVRRISVAAFAVVLGAAAVIMLFGAASAFADSSTSTPGRSAHGRSTPDDPAPDESSPDVSTPDTSAGGFSSHDLRDRLADAIDEAREDLRRLHLALSSPAPPGGESTPEPSPPTGTSTSSTGTATGGPTVGGGSATTGAAGPETDSVSTAPTPPNGAEPSAAGSPAAAVLPTEATPDESTAASPGGEDAPNQAAPAQAADPGSDAGAVPDFIGDALDATGPRPVAAGLSPDATKSGVFVAILALAVLLFLAAHQFVGRRDRGLAGARDAESVARFK